MKTFYTKCGREFLKSSTASVTGYRMKEDDIQCHGDESSGKIPCPFRKAVTKGWPQVFDHWECRAGSKKPNHKNEWIGSLEDKNTIHIRSLNNDFLESIMEFCYLHPHLAASFNQDLDDCRCVISVCCSPNIDRRNENKLCYLKAETSEKKMEYFIRFQEVNDILFLLLNLERDEI